MTQKKCDYVESMLEDEQSKYIFREKNKFNETGDWDCIENIVDRYIPEFRGNVQRPDKQEAYLNKLCTEKTPVYQYGAGARGQRMYELLLAHGISIQAIYDKNPQKKNDFFKDIEVKSADEMNIADFKNGGELFISPYYDCQIVEDLKKRGIPDTALKRFLEAELDSQYFEQDIMQFGENEIFADCGAYDFRTSLLFLDKVRECGGSCKKIYAFEPDSANARLCEAKIKGLQGLEVELINAGCWSSRTTLHFVEQNTSASFITSNGQGVQLEVVPLDDYLSDGVTFIKMDIEGSELEALKGAAGSIRKYHPKLAICVYHKPEDMWEIPCYIKELWEGYRLYLRHYGNNACETVLYAV